MILLGAYYLCLAVVLASHPTSTSPPNSNFASSDLPPSPATPNVPVIPQTSSELQAHGYLKKSVDLKAEKLQNQYISTQVDINCSEYIRAFDLCEFHVAADGPISLNCAP